jgi:hypothetical protein
MKILRVIAVAGIAVGILDGVAAIVSAGLRGVTPDRVFQYISSGLLGRSAFEGGAATVALGVLLHFVVAFGAAAVFVAAARAFVVLNEYPWITGPIYGVLVYFFMGEVVSALSNVSRGPRTVSGTITGILIHIFFVGLPIALISSKGADQPLSSG